MLRKMLTSVFTGFAALCLAGAVLLMLPPASTGEPLNFLDALFTSTSAVCVTGLVVVDTATDLSLFGQLVVLGLIQLGGLGIITFSVMIVLLLGRRLNLMQKEILRLQRVGSNVKFDLARLGRGILAFVVVAELSGTIILSLAFLRYFPPHEALYHGLFQAVSGFCNAGFSTFSTSLARFGGDPLVLVPMMLLIIMGGLGFMVIVDINDSLRRREPLTLQTRLVIVMTLALLIGGTVLFYLIESGNVLKDKPLGEQVLASVFHSVTCRTAGFNTVSYLELSNATLILTIVLMIIGGSPGGTAGGVKTTTAMIIFLTAWARIRGRQEPQFGNRSLARRTVSDAITLSAIVAMLLLALGLLMQLTELGNKPHTENKGAMMELHFETVSAMGTVGLSMGATPNLSPLGRIIIIFTMFVGRLGPMTFFSLLGEHLGTQKYKLYEESVMVG